MSLKAVFRFMEGAEISPGSLVLELRYVLQKTNKRVNHLFQVQARSGIIEDQSSEKKSKLILKTDFSLFWDLYFQEMA